MVLGFKTLFVSSSLLLQLPLFRCFGMNNSLFFSRYTSGEVRLWDTRTWDYTAPILEPVHGPGDAGPQPRVSFVRINSSLAVAAYEDGK